MDVTPIPLPERERDVLWLAAQGYTSEYIAREHHFQNVKSVHNVYARIAGRLGTRTLTHSVAYAILHGLIGPYRDCGTRRAYLRHLRKDESACVACRRANTAYVQAQRTAPLPDDVGLTPTQTKILQVLDDRGCTQGEAADILGMDRRRIGSHMTDVYRRLGIHHLYRYDRLRTALAIARSRGYITPSASEGSIGYDN